MTIGKLDINNWSYAGNKLDNPFIIMWKLTWFIPFKVSVLIACLFALLGFGWCSAKGIWEECR